MIGSGDEEHIITRVVPGTDPMQDFEDDDPSQFIVIDNDTDASRDVDDLSEVSMASAGGIGKQEFQGLLSEHPGTAPTNGGFSGRPGLQGGRHVGGASRGGGSKGRLRVGPRMRFGRNHRSLRQG